MKCVHELVLQHMEKLNRSCSFAHLRYRYFKNRAMYYCQILKSGAQGNVTWECKNQSQISNQSQKRQSQVPTCTTTSGPRPGQSCVFPFRHLGIVYTGGLNFLDKVGFCQHHHYRLHSLYFCWGGSTLVLHVDHKVFLMVLMII